MTAATMTRARTANTAQLTRLSTIYSLSILQTIGIATLVGAAISGALWVGLKIFGIETGTVTYEEPDGSAITTITFAVTWLGIPLAAAMISAFVHSIVIGSGYIRVPLTTGATRTNITIATGIGALVGALALTVLAFAILFTERLAGIQQTDSLFQTDWFGSGLGSAAGMVAVAGLATLSLLAFGHAVGLLFIRFHWIIGVGALLLLFVVLPVLAEKFDWQWYEWLTSFGLAQYLILAVLGFGAYALFLRRIQVD
ncbi:MAG: hypothetical protein Q4G64_00570 [bacterium]|nr:hypothetical protein [bacterium]